MRRSLGLGKVTGTSVNMIIIVLCLIVAEADKWVSTVNLLSLALLT